MLSNLKLKKEASPLEVHHHDLRIISDELFSPLTGEKKDHSPALQRIWSQAQADFKSGWLEEEEAKLLASTILRVKELNKERLAYVDRYHGIQNYDHSSSTRSKNSANVQVFAQNELDRQWKDWVIRGRAEVNAFLSSLSS